MSIDPVTTDADTGSGFNRYAYANNNPYKYIDPDGRLAFLIPLIPYIVGGGTVAIVGHYALPGRQGREDTARAVGNAILNQGGKKDTLQPGEHAGKSVPARGPDRDFSKGERAEINEIGGETGCHTCGTKDPGTSSGNFIPDHQPPNSLNPTGGAQELYPHCLTCSRTQGGQVRGEQNRKPKPPEPKKPEKEITTN